MQPIILKPGREKSVLRRHPWIFSGAVSKLPLSAGVGDTIPVQDNGGSFLAWAAFNPKSKIIGRIWSWESTEIINDIFFYHRLENAIESRKKILNNLPDTDAMRLVHGESDGIPGLIVDQYADILVFQFLSAGVEKWKDILARSTSTITGKNILYERSDVDVRRLEGLDERVGCIFGVELPGDILVKENGLRFKVDVKSGHKTGFYLDQRYNRYLLRELAKDRDVLDCFCYTGGFTCSAILGGARSVISVDASVDALHLAEENLSINKLDSSRVEFRQGDVFQVLREMRDRGRSFDLIILDPPKFAQSAAQVERAARGYKDINLLAFKLLRKGGLLVTFSCSGGVEEVLFQKIVAGAALDAGVNARILQRLSQGSDHPVALNFPEGTYLKGFIVQVI